MLSKANHPSKTPIPIFTLKLSKFTQISLIAPFNQNYVNSNIKLNLSIPHYFFFGSWCHIFIENIHWKHQVGELSVICQVSKSQTRRLFKRLIKIWAWPHEVQILWGQFWGQNLHSQKHLKMLIKHLFEVFWWPSQVRINLTS